jgi:hypothetical protein
MILLDSLLQCLLFVADEHTMTCTRICPNISQYEQQQIILHDQTTAYNCRSISRTAAVQAIQYELSPIKNSSKKVDR